MTSRRPSPHTTPFIPPLATPNGSPQPPVIPQLATSSSSGSNQGFVPPVLPTTQSTPWPASAYPPGQGGAGPAQPPPMFQPQTPGFPAFSGYPMMTPGMPPGQMAAPSPYMNFNMGYVSPNMTPGFIPPGVITPHTPGQPPLPGSGFLPHGGGIHPNGMSYDYVGYPPFVTPGAPGHIPLSAPPNHTGHAAMQQAQAQAQASQAAMQQAQAQARAAAAAGGFPGAFGGPMSAPPVIPQGAWGPGPGAGGGGWGFSTPAAAMHQPLAGGWSGMDALTAGMAGMGMGGGGFGGMNTGGLPSRRAVAEVADRVGEFAAGESYHPVLNPFIIKIVGAKMKVNPILQAPATSSSGHLKWNVLFPSSTIHFSKDPSHKSWSGGRDDPATFPRTTQVRVLANVSTYPWYFTVDAKNPKVGVTCGEIIEQIHHELKKMTGKGDWSAVPRDLQSAVAGAYRFNRGRDSGAPGGVLGEGMRRLDYLREFVWWAGLEPIDPSDDQEYSDIMRKWLNQHGPQVVNMPCMLLLRLESMSTRSVDEVRDWENTGRQRRSSMSASATSRHRSSSRAPSAQGGGGLGAGSRSRANSRVGSRPGSSVGFRVEHPSDSDESEESD